ncbi:Serine/threonine-protein kinase crk1 [Taphrina deformans PYCC 5710]|uniref:[RNA-polymerase]-subunit kinase n=1 Tax=Taphrina deformans (strain PYCC 5710 / ATCC 11124 / CBS 356.35 / IMI 108563 / JCM 9778 / NBRC 8474) TaxID=1097556 RepID=R4XC99_TAPDE|nr:Serine/threonine-protein kinase crk1 [Taphrina deformans PYCC 5710]|eukprot:CCG80955.1 Serine/threonine-protein kinase crk1 [Taphrina deformans PYCC 5710]
MSTDYIKQEKLGEGTYAVVYSGRQVSTGRTIAIKKIKIGQFKEGLDMSAIREVKFLRELHHENVIELIDVYSHKQNLNLILEFLSADLEHLIKDRSIVFSTGNVKSWVLMMLRGLHYLHTRFVLHRDLKPNNLLLSSAGVLKLADFGLARDFGAPYANMSPNVVTRWYRAPELFLGARSYGTGIDLWAAGCIFAELLLRNPYLPGENDMGQLNIIFQALGTPSEHDWPGFRDLPSHVDFKQYPKPDARLLFSAASEEELDLLHWMLSLDPLKRPTTLEALRHKYFSNLPRPTEPEKLPTRGGGLAKVVNDLKRPAGDMVVDSGRGKLARKLF